MDVKEIKILCPRRKFEGDSDAQRLEWSSCLDQEDLEPLLISEEQEEPWPCEEEEQRHVGDVRKFPFSPTPVKSGEHEEKRRSSELHWGRCSDSGDTLSLASDATQQKKTKANRDDFGGAEPDRGNSTSDSSETEDSEDRMETRRTQPSLNRVGKAGHVSHEKAFGCTVCKKRFVRKINLKRHMVTHTGDKPYSCSLCHRNFSRKGNMMTHMTTHTGEKPFCCGICGKSFSRKGTITRHMRTHSGEKPFGCDVCGKSFSQKGTMVRHTRTHTGDKPFSCSVCEKSFSRKENMTTHLRTHTEGQRYDCEILDSGLSQKETVTGCDDGHAGETVRLLCMHEKIHDQVWS